MQHARRLHLGRVAAAIALLSGCTALDAPQQQPPQNPGQWAPPGQWVPPGQMQPPMAPPVQPGPGQWVPPQPSAGPIPWWQGGTIPVPAVGPIQVPGLPTVPGMPGGAAQQCVDTINQYRAQNGLPPLA